MPCSTPIVAVRADVGRLPFATGTVDAIHAGAAIHCWPNPQAAMAEISRVLKPGGIFVASTFLTPFAPLGEIVGDSTIRPISQVGLWAGQSPAAHTDRVVCLAAGQVATPADCMCQVTTQAEVQRQTLQRVVLCSSVAHPPPCRLLGPGPQQQIPALGGAGVD